MQPLGNVPAVIDESADMLLAVNSIIRSKNFDNGMICASEQSGIVHTTFFNVAPDPTLARAKEGV